MSKPSRIDVMVSSTSLDLPNHRKLAIDAILRVGYHPLAMEHLGAANTDALGISLKMVDDAEVYIGIFGARYGYIPDDPIRNPQRLSITELEYRRALERGIPILIFFMSPKHRVPARRIDQPNTFEETSEEGKEKLAKLKQELGLRHVAGFFSSASNLHALIMQALRDENLFVTEPPVRITAKSVPKTIIPDADDTGIPKPPALYSVPPYTLTNTFVGRKAELAELNRWAKSRDPIMIYEAIGGMGKSALTWEWVRGLNADPDQPDFDGLFWYSFYEGGAQMKDFLRHAVAYVTRQDPDKLKSESHDDLALKLLTELNTRRWLLVLDGVERLLVAYHRIDAAQVQDDEVRRDLRDCTSNKDNRLLQKLAGVTRSKLLISSRLMPRALEDAGKPITGVQKRLLTGLLPDDALDLLRDRGVTWDDERELDRLLRQIGYHGLLLKVIAGRIKTHRRARGHFDTWYEWDGKALNLFEMTDEVRRTHILADALKDLEDDKRLLLSQIAAFGSLVEFETVAIFNPYVDMANHDEAYLKSAEYKAGLATFDAALTELEDRGLLQWDRDADTYDLHPVVRGYSFSKLEGREETFGRIYDHFSEKPRDPYEQAETLDDLKIALTIYRALVGAGRFDQAASFFGGSFEQALLHNLNAYTTIVELLTPLFPDGVDAEPRIADESVKGYILNTLGFALSEVGSSRSALAVCRRTVELGFKRRNYRDLGTRIRNYAATLRDLNALAAVQQGIELARALAVAASNTQETATNSVHLLSIHVTRGAWADAEVADSRLRFNAHNIPRNQLRPGNIELLRAKAQFYRGADSRRTIRAGLERARADRALQSQMWLHALSAQVELAAGDLTAADDSLDQALAIAKRSGSFSQAPYTALLAEIRLAQGEIQAAKDLIDEAFVLTMIEFDKAAIYNSAAIVYHSAGDFDRARDYALQAYKVAWADGEPYSQWYELKRAR
ncbi:MAG: DUF4062 domain-containing protein, partial [Anaerolinea sp.]|nr:DUF4062 domain-containing protein [Anaerolinea sp.]